MPQAKCKKATKFTQTLLGEMIAERIKKSGLSVQAFARKIGLPQTSLFRIIYGQVKRPSIESINAIAAGLGMDPQELYTILFTGLPSPVIHVSPNRHAIHAWLIVSQYLMSQGPVPENVLDAVSELNRHFTREAV